ncbi:hypothetical protein [Spirosoma litoris]
MIDTTDAIDDEAIFRSIVMESPIPIALLVISAYLTGRSILAYQ